MRTLKFRRYNVYLKEMDEPIDWLPGERTDTDFWMQFTGLLDRHGKEIYEGDIVRHSYYGKGEVSFGDGYFKVVNLSGGEKYQSYKKMRLNAMQGDGEVIGNIYENPELL